MPLSQPLRLSRRTLLRQLGAAGVLVTLGPAGAWATEEMVPQAVGDRSAGRAPGITEDRGDGQFATADRDGRESHDPGRSCAASARLYRRESRTSRCHL